MSPFVPLHMSKCREVKTPNRANEFDAGIDFFMPSEVPFVCNGEVYNAEGLGALTILAHQQILIPSGIRARVPEGWALIGFNKSGMATKTGLTIGACVIDSDYQGEIHINLLNTSSKDVVLEADQKIAQFVMLPVGLHTPVMISDDSIFPEESDRGSGGFGSTN